MPQLSLYAIALLIVTNITTFTLWRFAANDALEMKVRGEVAQQKADSIVRQQEIITEETENAWSQNLAALRADYDRRLRSARSGSMPGISKPPARIDEITPDALPLAGQCAETTLQLEQLQNWIRQQELNK